MLGLRAAIAHGENADQFCLPLSEILGCTQPKVDGENVGIDTCVSVEFMRQIKDKQANKSQYQLL